MEFFFRPSGVAVVGATANRHKGGYTILYNVMRGFKGPIYPVNPRYQEIDGLPCFPSIMEVPDPVDLAILFIPAPLVPEVVTQCARRGIRGVIVESGGFSEAGPEGRTLQERLCRIAADTGLRVWGPNCMGLIDMVTETVFSFVAPAIWDVGLLRGGVSLVVQSGMLSAGFLIDTFTRGDTGFAKVCSLGNKADVNECEILKYLLNDPDTKTVGLYLESFVDGRAFMDICVASDKPVVVLKGGKSPVGSRAAMSHTASLAGDRRVVSGALAQAGVVEASDFRQMIDLCRGLTGSPFPRSGHGGRIAVITYTGAGGIVSADFLEEMGLTVADLSSRTLDALKDVYPDWMSPANPLDLWPAMERNGPVKALMIALETVCADQGVDGVLLHVFIGGVMSNLDLARISQIVRDAGKPLFCWLLGMEEKIREFKRAARQEGIPVYGELHRTVECMATLFRHAKDPKGG
ncbi:MAG: CoA-binding protein [Deltaproteobacteria bacterium]|nr:CoA-binding protein [Deltaproteobacteria bacterium]MBW2112353.1 CoA-binding protein [Deltaproteobacteria bacterium]MBW2354897.1 CoA-binding protein [Deltaproteobacteria bacterium]